MRKRIMAMVLTVVVLISVFAFPVNAASSSEGAALRQKITQTYKRLRASNGYDSYNGYCGKMAAYTLYYLGVDKRVYSHNGKDEYDAYKNMDVTTGGHKVVTYPASQYSLEEALNAISEGGTRDVYNILVGFQRTNTTAGRKFGHAVVIYGILDGMVYFTESFTTSLGGKEGAPVVCTIKDFATSYNKWTTFEGIVYFGTKSYADFCTYYPADLYVESLERINVYSIPSDVNVDGYTAKKLTTIVPQERIEVSGLYENKQGKLFYEINYGGMTGFIEAGKTRLIRSNSYKITASDFNVPTALKLGQDFTVNGSVFLKQDGLTTLKLAILDQASNELYSHRIKKDGVMVSVTKAASNALLFSKLKTGVYTYVVTCDVQNCYVEGGELIDDVTAVTLVNKTFTVGNAELPPQQDNPPAAELMNGWRFDETVGQWKYYIDGVLAHGWVFDNNVDYYILEDGTFATGCVEINGENRYFTASGVMRTGWYDTPGGRMYLLSNGAAAKGWHEIDGAFFYFNQNGILSIDPEQVPENQPQEEIPAELLFAELFEDLNTFTELYEKFFH